jgi:peptidoglycan/xylan/chitin deacetylase (PgdA/CDA1 family)
MNPEFRSPFAGELNTLQGAEGFDIHKLDVKKLDGVPESTNFPEGTQREFKTPAYSVTEYFSAKGKDHQSFAKLVSFYRDAQKELGEFLPKTFFVEAEPSSGEQGVSFYVVQKFDDPEFNKNAKNFQELNSQEFSVEFLNQLLVIQEKINAFLEKHINDFTADWITPENIDPKTFKEGILYSPANKQIQLSGLFKLSPTLAKVVTGSEGKFKPPENRLKLLKFLGLSNLQEKINWAIEKSAAPEWVAGKNIHWGLDKSKLEREGKKAMALTFDDGPNEETEKLLDILKEKNAKATFFIVGSRIAGRENIVKRIIDEGHDIGVHEWGQEGARPGDGLKEYSKRFVGPRKDLGDVKRTAELIESVTGVRPTIGRIAGVHGTVDSLREFQATGLEVIHGNPYDVVAIPPRKDLPAGNLLKKALSSNGQGRIRIFHIGVMKDGGDSMGKDEVDVDKGEVYPPEETLKMMPQFIDESRKQGYEFVKVKEYI